MKTEEFTFTDKENRSWIISCERDRVSSRDWMYDPDNNFYIWKWYLIKKSAFDELNQTFLTGEIELRGTEVPVLRELVPHIFNEFTRMILKSY